MAYSHAATETPAGRRVGERVFALNERFWRAAFVALIFAIWLVPIKTYTLPVRFGFNLEIYRLFVIIMLLAFSAAVIDRRAFLFAGGLGRPALLLAIGAVLSFVVNIGAIDSAGL